MWRGSGNRGRVTASRARLFVIASSLLASTGGTAIKLCGLPAAHVAGLRAGVAVLALSAFLRPGRGSWTWRAALVGGTQAVMMATFVASNKLTTAASAIYLESTAPLFVLLLAPLLLREPIRARDIGYLLVFAACLAVFFVRVDAAQPSAPEPALGNLVGAAGGLLWGLTILGLRWVALRATPTSDPAGAATVIANALVFAVALPWIGRGALDATAADWLPLLWLGVFQVGLSYALLTRALRSLSAFEVSLLVLVEPAFSPLWAWLFLGERPGGWSLAAGAAILLTTAARSLGSARPARLSTARAFASAPRGIRATAMGLPRSEKRTRHDQAPSTGDDE